MTKEQTFEFSGPTVEEAVEKGLSELGLSADDVVVEVLDEGKRNLFHFASRQARVRLTVRQGAVGSKPAAAPSAREPKAEPESERPQTRKPASEEAQTTQTHMELAAQVVKEILTRMGVDAALDVETRPVEEVDRDVIFVNIEGDDLSFLIGRHSETLNALQHISSLIVSHRAGEWVPMQLDVQNYRSRRENELKKIARRTAEQVATTSRKQCLEPMPANERRIIHMALRDNPDVYSESTGEEPSRKVCIYPKK